MIDASPSSFRVDGVRAAGWARRRLSLAAGDASCGRPSRAVVTPFGWTILLRLGNVVLASHPPTPTPSPSTRGRSGSGRSVRRHDGHNYGRDQLSDSAKYLKLSPNSDTVKPELSQNLGIRWDSNLVTVVMMSQARAKSCRDWKKPQGFDKTKTILRISKLLHAFVVSRRGSL